MESNQVQSLIAYLIIHYVGSYTTISFKVPLGLVDDASSPYQGIPVGVQVVAARGQDRLTLAVAAEAERLMGGWVPPNGVV